MTEKRRQFETATPVQNKLTTERHARRLGRQADIIIESGAGSLFSQPKGMSSEDYESALTAFDAMCERALERHTTPEE